MIRDLSNSTTEEIERNVKKNVCRVEDNDDYDFDKVCESLNELYEKENERMIEQNDKGLVGKEGTTCFDTALKGSKTYLKSRF